MKKDINYYLSDFGKLSKTQIASARDSGFSFDEIKNKRQNWYDENKTNFKFTNKGKGKATSKQLAFLEANVPAFDAEQAVELTFSYARKVIRQLAKEAGTETDYLDFINAQEAHDEARSERKEKTKKPKSKFVNFDNDIIPVAFNEDDLSHEAPFDFVEQASDKRDLAWYLRSEEGNEIEDKRAFDEMTERLALKKTVEQSDLRYIEYIELSCKEAEYMKLNEHM